MHTIKRGRGLVAVLATMAMAAVGISSTSSADGATTGPPTLATGHISYAAGVSTGQVMILVDPNNVTISKDTTGATLATPMLASADVGSDGNFTLTLDPATVPSSDKMPDGSINVEAVAVSGGQQLPFFFEATPVLTPTGTQWISISNVGTKTADLQFNMASGTVVNAKYSPTKWLNADGRQTSASKLRATSASMTTKVSPTMQKMSESVAAGTSATTTDLQCGLIPLSPVTSHGEHFINLYTDGSSKTHLAELVGTTHTLGIAVEGSDGSFHAGGTSNVSESNSVKSTSPDYQHSHDVWNKVFYRPFTDTCIHKVIKKGIGWNDLVAGDLDGPVSYVFFTASCIVKDNHALWDTEQATSATFSFGVTVGGVGLSAQSGYKDDTNLHIEMLEHGSIRGSSSAGVIFSSKLDTSTFGCP